MTNFDEIREQFPIVNDWLYFDASSLSPYCLMVLETLKKFQKERTENGSVPFDDWYSDIDKGRKLAAKICGAKDTEIALTKNTSEGINLVALLMDWEEEDNVVLCDLDFPANIYPFLNLKSKGVDVKYAKNANGTILPEDIEREIDENTKLVSLSHVIYSNGFRVDIEKIGAICREKGVRLHVDATQSLGVVPTDVKKSGIDFLSVGAYKWLLSPLGSGFLYINEEFLDRAPILGWLSVKDPKALDIYNYEILDSASRFEIGNLDVGAFLGMKTALELIDSVGVEKIEKRVVGLTSFLLEELKDIGLEVISDFERENASGIVSFLSNEVTKEVLLENQIVATVRDHIRFSPHIYNTENELSKAAEIIGALHRG